MLRALHAAAILSFAVVALSVTARASDPQALGDAAAVFDGGGGAPMRDAVADFSSARKMGAVPVAAVRRTKQSGADLFYFSPQEAAQAKKTFGIMSKTAKGFTFDSDVPADIKKQMLADLDFMKTIQGGSATALHKKIFGAVDGSGYYGWFDSRVTAIGLDDCGSANAVACVMPFSDPSKMWLTNNFIKFSHPQVARMMVVYHEARHTESQHGNWSHATCPTPFRDDQGKDMKSIWTGAKLAGEPACDVTPLGSYGSSTILLKNVQKYCSNCTDKVKMDAGLYADDQLGRVIDKDAKRQMQQDFGQ
ncbi:MAG: hypothetical protein NTX64_12795 [Elusimicrobia bacterium]|nr:hypothetical protein [Elusimicrobiota bacterium]